MFELPLVEKFIGIVQSCRREKSLSNAYRILMLIQENGLERHRVLGNYVIPMLVECGSMREAHDFFSKLVHPNEHSWTSLIQGCIEQEDFEHALHLFQRMQGESVYLSIYTFQAVLKACAALKCLARGRDTHAKIIEHGAENDPFLLSSLVDMYAKCFSCEEARHVLSNAQHQDVVAWNALISGYAEHGEGMDALDCFGTLQRVGICPSAVTFACSLKACGNMGALNTGQELHAEVITRGYELEFCVDGTLVYMYSKCGLLVEASHVLSDLKVKNVVCWTSLIAGYAEHGYGEEALSCLKQMQLEGVAPNPMTYACCVKGCGNVRTLEKTKNLYIEIAKKGYDRDPFISNSLLDLYGKQGFLLEACKIFDTLFIQDIFSWNALLSGHCQNGFAQEVLHFFNLMHAKGVPVNAVTFGFTIKACCATQDVERGQQLHIEIVKRGFEKDECIDNSLMDMYMKLGAFEVGSRMFYGQIVHDVVSWTSLLGGYVEQGSPAEALECLGQMQQEAVSPSIVTYVCCLRACMSRQDLITGYKLHSEVTVLGLDTDPSVMSNIIDMYAKCGSLKEAQAVFEELNVRDEQAWSALLSAYGEHGFLEHESRCLEHMELDGVCPDSSTYFFMLKAHYGPGSSERGYELHTSIIIKGFENDLWIASALVVLYGNALSMIEAEQLLYKLPCRNVVVWTALVTAYADHEQFEKALGCLETMELDGVSPNGVTLLCSLKAAGAIGAISSGHTVHAEMMKKGLETESTVGNALVDMYAKCGCLLEAQEHFERLPLKDSISWTALITGYASKGESKRVFQLLERMDNEGIVADGVTYLSVLLVCSHVGLVHEGIAFLGLIMRQDNVALAFEHYSCMVDLVARAGQLANAVLLLEEMPFQPNRVAWTTMLGACRNWQDVTLGRQAFESLRGLDESIAAAFLLMLGIYGNADG